MAAKTDKSIEALLQHSFKEMLQLLNKNQAFTTREVKGEFIEEQEFKTIMFTVSSSNFRLVVLLHFLPKSELNAELYDTLKLDPACSTQYYQDFICELGNNFCGVICRVLGAADFSTGMSTPAILANKKSIINLRSVCIDFETHAGGFVDNQVPLCASMCLFFNKGANMELNIPIPAASHEQENLGELEFF